MAECHMNGLVSAEAFKSLGFLSNCQKKRQTPQGQCANFMWTADDYRKDGSQGIVPILCGVPMMTGRMEVRTIVTRRRTIRRLIINIWFHG